MGISAYYFDGKTSRKHQVELSVDADIALVTGDIERRCPLAELRVSEKTRHAARRVTFPDGAYLEIIDKTAFNQLLADSGHRDSLVVRLQQSWRAALATCGATVLILVLLYLYGLPLASELIAKALPEKVERSIGQETLSFLDKHMMAPSTLPVERRDAIVKRFQSLRIPGQHEPSYEIVFRKSKIGPNAFALPSGQIVLTDEIVKLVDSDDAVMGVLAHELGHLHERHLIRRMIQGTAIGTATATLFGDASSLVVGLPTLMLDLRYSRDAEREADDYAVTMLKANGIPLAKLADMFEKIDGKSAEPMPYLSSHPPGIERAERIRNAQ